MLFTRCPDCETTFRITDDALKKANGQVRCGRCASVFNAYAELHDPAAKSFDTASANAIRQLEPSLPPPAPLDAAPTAAGAAPTPSALNAERVVPEPIAESIGARSLEDVVRHRFVYRPQDAVAFADPVERRSMAQHLARLQRQGRVREVEAGRFAAR